MADVKSALDALLKITEAASAAAQELPAGVSQAIYDLGLLVAKDEKQWKTDVQVLDEAAKALEQDVHDDLKAAVAAAKAALSKPQPASPSSVSADLSTASPLNTTPKPFGQP